MIIYEKDKIHRMEMTEQAEIWFRRKQISSEEYVQIRTMNVGGYTEPKLLPRLGHFIFGSLIVWSALGILLLAMGSGGVKACGGMAFVYGIALYGATGFYLKQNELYRSGITHATLFFALLCAFSGLAILSSPESGDPVMWMICLLASIGISYTSIRYISSFFALLAWMCFIAFVIFLLFRMGGIGKAIAPFLTMLLSAGMYAFLKKKEAQTQWKLWSRLLDVLMAAAVFTFYLAGNYYVVREMSGFDIYSYSKSEIPLAWFFYSFTVLVPVLYIIAGLAKKNRLFLHAGLICTVLAVASIRYYHSFMPADIALTGVGIFLTIFSWWAIRFLHASKAGITSQADPDDSESSDDKNALKGLNQLIISRAATGTHSSQQNDAPSDDVSFGGGSGGGGGAGSEF